MKYPLDKNLLLPLFMSGNTTDIEHDDQVVVEPSEPMLKSPSMYQVVMLNDDYSPMEFVVEVLETFFNLDREGATRVMLTVHTAGRAAETKAMQANQYARENQHPLLCEVESLPD